MLVLLQSVNFASVENFTTRICQMRAGLMRALLLLTIFSVGAQTHQLERNGNAMQLDTFWVGTGGF